MAAAGEPDSVQGRVFISDNDAEQYVFNIQSTLTVSISFCGRGIHASSSSLNEMLPFRSTHLCRMIRPRRSTPHGSFSVTKSIG